MGEGYQIVGSCHNFGSEPTTILLVPAADTLTTTPKLNFLLQNTRGEDLDIAVKDPCSELYLVCCAR